MNKKDEYIKLAIYILLLFILGGTVSILTMALVM